MLPKVSRTFALGIRLLPSPLSYRVTVAYLLCRIADTVEDATSLSVPAKRELLQQYASSLEEGEGEGNADPSADVLRAAFANGTTHEDVLAAHAGHVLGEFRRLPSRDQAAIRPWVQEMCTGMAEFARPGTDANHDMPDGTLDTLGNLEELDRYCYYVAGTVGHMLTALFRLHDPSATSERYRSLTGLATSFGLGLQLTNIIKDVADDHHRGWSFVPRDLCEQAGIPPERLFDARYRPQARRVMDALIAHARQHLDDSLDYCTRLARTQYRVRVFCLTSLYFAVRTLRRAATDHRLLDPQHKLKITRGEVYRTVATTHAVAPSNALIRAYYRSLG